MVEGGSILEHLNEFNTITNQLDSMKLKFDDELKVLLLLCSLVHSWNSLVMTVSNDSSNGNKLIFDDVVSTLLNEDIRRKYHR